jgi:hypothetical protein
MKKVVRKTGYDDAKLFEMAHEMVSQRTFVSGVMNFLASKGENGTGGSSGFKSGTTFIQDLTSDGGPNFFFLLCGRSAAASVTPPPPQSLDNRRPPFVPPRSLNSDPERCLLSAERKQAEKNQ